MTTYNGVPLDRAGIVSTVMEGLLYGFSLFMFGITLWVLFYHRATKDVNRPMVVVAVLLFAFSTMHLGVDIHRIMQGLVDNRNFPNGPAAWFADPSQFTFVFKNAIYSFQTVLGDGVVIYRCYMVWQSVYIIIFPLIMLSGVAVTAAGSVWACSQATPTQGGIFFQRTGQWITAFYSSTLSTNLICTFLLAFRIWQINSRVRNHHGGSTLMPVLLIIIDAGLLYSVTLLSALLCFVNHSNGQYVVLDMVMPIISIVFYMVIIRVGIAKVTPSHQGDSSGFGNALSQTQNRDYAMRPLEVHISQLTESQKDKIDQRSDASISKHAEEV
ncbi:hypothetical protein HETIRDRAFT_442452 [Heterobasidion irregulare TC 32-1]|uniref:Uncharacterized protein n=1 Tax=Heterobasidion irregulare (strain TC 32-1) TaxID=747525 RepID=W4JNW5_HETIT|nr:uncharacterized protein HETIRDRAFT_442452 [Heterobasidion irregulare TC 32-1]ETW75179.1 hypothetical protein HETIRDRAFT_442452 [Heterobasidion irregulare TC 32-1]